MMYGISILSDSFGIGVMFANFHLCGMMLYMLVRYASPNGLMCLRCLIFTVALFVLLCFIAS